MPSFFKRLGLLLKGGIPSISSYEDKRTALRNQYERYLLLKDVQVMQTYRELATQLATPASQSGIKGRERKQMKLEFKNMRQLPEVVEFFSLQKITHNFGEITKWKLTFEDDFDGTTLDTQKWQVTPMQSPMLPAVDCSPANADFVYAGSKNINMPGGAVQLLTKHETAQGLAFSQEFGFVNVERNHTSGIINTGMNFGQQYGKVEVRFKFTASSKHIYHALWLSSGLMHPHINLLHIGKRLQFGVYGVQADQKAQDAWKRSMLQQNTPYILTVEWDAKRIQWMINGVEMFSTPNIINEPLFFGASSGVVGRSTSQHPSILELDWIRIYQIAKEDQE